MKRRGILGMFGAGAAAAAAPADLTVKPRYSTLRAAFGSSIGYGGPGVSEDGAACSNQWTEADAKALVSLRRQMQHVERAAGRRTYARDRTLALCEGHAPHVVTCRSWAPWFRAQATVRWQLAKEAEDHEEERRRTRSIAGTFSTLVRGALPEWLRDRLEDDA